MAQDPEPDEEQTAPEDQVDPSHDLDMVPLYNSQTIDSEQEADLIQGVLEASGIPSIVVGSAQLPNLGVEVQVQRSRLEEAEEVIAAAEAAGPEAAAEAEAASEEGQ
jgi:hypothetical protein